MEPLSDLGAHFVFHMYVYELSVWTFFRSGAFDSLDKAFCILKLDSTGLGQKSSESDSESDNPTTPIDLIRRVDLIVSPPDQYPFALVSWTGSKVTSCKDLYIIFQHVSLPQCTQDVAVTIVTCTIVAHFVWGSTFLQWCKYTYNMTITIFHAHV